MSLVLAVAETDLFMITNCRCDCHEKFSVDFGVGSVGAGVLRPGLYGVSHGIDPQFEPVWQHGLKLGQGAGAGLLNAAHPSGCPQADRDGHGLVVVKQQWRQLGANPEAVISARAAYRLARRAREALGADGVNLMNSWGSDAWQTVFHFHLHVIPRYTGDPLKLPWKPAPGNEGEIAAAAEALREG